MEREDDDSPALPHPVLVVGVALVVLQLVLRGWASLGGWFTADDFELMSRLHGTVLTWDRATTPHDSPLMPGGIALSWLMTASGPFNWTVAAWALVGMQALASVSCLLMLVVAFGRRWALLPLLALYLFSPLTLTAYMWWSAAINQLPVQASFFLTFAAAIHYLRTRRLVWALVTVLAIVLGLAFSPKAALLMPMVAGLAALFFAPRTGAPGRRLVRTARRLAATVRAYAPLWAALLALGGAYTWYYLDTVGNPLAWVEPAWFDLGATMLRVGLVPALAGGPWAWRNPIPPRALVDPPTWGIALAWLLVLVGVAWLVRRRNAHWRALGLLGAYLLVSVALLGMGPGGVGGAVSPYELRHLADAMPVITLCLGLLVLGVRTTADVPVEPTTTPSPAPGRLLPRVAAGALGLVVLAGSLVSTVRYVGYWHEDVPARRYTLEVIDQARIHDLRVVDAWVPEDVLSALHAPANSTAAFFRPLPEVRVLDSGNDLLALDEDGRAAPAYVEEPALFSEEGPQPGCGHLVTTEPVVVALEQRDPPVPLDPVTWLEIGYVGSEDGLVHLEYAGVSQAYPVERGPHTLLVQVRGADGQVTMQVETEDVALCVDRVRVGPVEPMEAP